MVSAIGGNRSFVQLEVVRQSFLSSHANRGGQTARCCLACFNSLSRHRTSFFSVFSKLGSFRRVRNFSSSFSLSGSYRRLRYSIRGTLLNIECTLAYHSRARTTQDSRLVAVSITSLHCDCLGRLSRDRAQIVTRRV